MPAYFSIIIPAYNEEHRIADTLRRVGQYLSEWQNKTGRSFEIIVVDDGSSDGTSKVVQSLGARLIRFENNGGKGAAIKAGMMAATGQFRLFADADNSTPIEELEKFWPLLEAGAHVVIGSRALKESNVVISQSFYRRNLGRLANLLIQAVCLPGIKDTQCGFKCFHATAAQKLFGRQTINAFGFDFEILTIARRHGYKIHEVPVSWYNEKSSRVRPIYNALTTLAELFKIRWNLFRRKYD